MVPRIEAMLRALYHRGPDDSGWTAATRADRSEAEALLGATRLAILDVSFAGHQPMRDPATGNWIVLNGEIYNHLDLRAELGQRGEPWRSGSDTETILRSYAVWGMDVLPRLRGMFALAIWDASQGALLLARDRLGIKPVYFTEVAEGVAFASEVRAFTAGGLLKPQLDRMGLSGYLKFGSVPEPLTLFRGVSSLAAGHWMRIERGRVSNVGCYWSPVPSPKARRRLNIRHLREQLERAITEHLLSDVPVASFLSGGVDSSVVTAVAARNSRLPLRTFTLAFRETGFDESNYAKVVAEKYQTLHWRVLLSEDDILSQVPSAVAALDLPSADGVNTYVISRAVASAGIKVVLSGLGGDELFGGYDTFRRLQLVEEWRWLLRALPAYVVRRMRGDRAVQVAQSRAGLDSRYEALRSYWSERDLRAMGADVRASYESDDAGPAFPIPARASVFELQGYMRSTLLRDSDVMSMAHSLELRVPFLDHKLVEFCVASNAAEAAGKAALVEAVRGLLPPMTTGRPKQGFVLPMQRWMRGPLAAFVNDGLARLEASGFLPRLRPADVLRRFNQEPWMHSRVWQLAVLGHWLERNGPSAGAAGDASHVSVPGEPEMMSVV